MASNAETVSFTENFAKLKNISDTLRSQQEPNIDTLVPMVDEALTAFKNCKTRLDAVESMLKERLGEDAS